MKYLKSITHHLQKRRLICKFIKQYEEKWPVELMCKVLQVSRSSYYNWRRNPEGIREIKKESMKASIRKAYIDAHGYYESPRFAVELCAQNKQVSRTTVARYMKEMKLKSKLKRKFIATTSSDYKEPVAENLLNRQFNPAEPGVAYVSNITYLRTLAGFIYLTTVIDLFDRKVIGWSISYGMTTEETVLPALRMAEKTETLNQVLYFIQTEVFNMLVRKLETIYSLMDFFKA